MIRRTLACALILTLSWTGWAWAAGPTFAQETPGDPSYEEAMVRLDEFMGLIEELRSHIDRSQFDLEALLDKLDYDADNIIGFVKEEIYLEQYPGLLRGAQGTLMSRAGNALDQSVLLATLLKDAGYEARIAEGHLSPFLAKQLLHASFDTRKRPQGPFGPQDPSAILERFSESIAADLDHEATTNPEVKGQDVLIPKDIQELTEASASTARTILRILESEQISFGDTSLVEGLEQEASKYYWVQVKIANSADWIDVHPAISADNDIAIPPSLMATRLLSGEVPSELLHKVGFEVVLEQRSGANVKQKTVMPMWERPAANLVGKIMKYMNVPASLAGGKGGFPERDTELFFPAFSGEQVGNAFDMIGNLVPAEEAASSYAALFRQLGSKLNKAGGLLSSLGSTGGEPAPPKRLAELSALTLRITLTKPDGGKKQIERHLFKAPPMGSPMDSDGSNDEFLEAFADITQNVSFAILVGSTPAAFFWDRSLDALHGQLRTVRLSLTEGTSEDIKERLYRAPPTSDPAAVGLLGLDLDMTENLQILARDTIAYRSEPGVVSHRWRSQQNEMTSATTDILNNSRTALRKRGSAVAWAADKLVDSGVWETYLERLTMPRESGAPLGTTDSLAAADLERGEFSVLRSVSDLQSLTLDPEVSREIRRDLETDFVVLVSPQKVGVNLDKTAWWRVRPSTGETLGMIGPRIGGATTVEDVVMRNLVLIFVVWLAIAAVEFDACYSVPADGAGIGDSTLFKVCFACAGITATLWLGALLSIIGGLYTAGSSETVAAPTRAMLLAQLLPVAAQLGCSVASGLSD